MADYTVAEINSKGWIVDIRHETDYPEEAIRVYRELKADPVEERNGSLFDVFDAESLGQADAEVDIALRGF